MLKTKTYLAFKTKCSQKHTVNFLLNSAFSEKNGAKERRNFSLCTRIIKPERDKNGFVGWGLSMALLVLAREGKLLSLDTHLTACLSACNLLQIVFNIKHWRTLRLSSSSVSISPLLLQWVCKATFWSIGSWFKANSLVVVLELSLLKWKQVYNKMKESLKYLVDHFWEESDVHMSTNECKIREKTPMIFVPSANINPSASCEWSERFAELEMKLTSHSLLLSWPGKDRLVFFGPSSTSGLFMQFSAAPHSQMASAELLCWPISYPKWQVYSMQEALCRAPVCSRCPALSGVCCHPTRSEKVKELD